MLAIDNGKNYNSMTIKTKATKADRMAIISRFEQASCVAKRIEATHERLKKLQSLMKYGDGLEDSSAKNLSDVMLKAKSDLDNQIVEAIKAADDMNKLISYVPDERMRTILEMRYNDCNSMEEISKKLHCTPRNLYILHNRALDYIFNGMNSNK